MAAAEPIADRAPSGAPLNQSETTTRFTVVCSGASMPGCGRVISVREEPWSGSAELTSHGVCDECFEREERHHSTGLVRCAECPDFVEGADPRDAEPLCKRCREAGLEEIAELRAAERAQPVQSETEHLRTFGYGPGEIPSSKITQTLSGRARLANGAPPPTGGVGVFLLGCSALTVLGLIVLAAVFVQ